MQVNKMHRDILPIKNLYWIGKKENEVALGENHRQYFQHFFPQAKLEQIAFDAADEQMFTKKIALQFKRWSEEERFNTMGLICDHPMGFSNWQSFIDFVRMEPPVFLWKFHPLSQAIPKKILVPVDFSSSTERILPLIKSILQLTNVKEITLLNLYTTSGTTSDSKAAINLRKDKIEEMNWYFEANLDTETRQLLKLDAISKEGKDNSALLNDYIKSNQMDLVILGSHNFSHYHYLLYGSTTADVLNKTSEAHICVIF